VQGGVVKASFIAFVLQVTDIAGNARFARTTAVFAPVNDSDSSIKTAPGALLTITSAVDRSTRNPAFNHVWQTRVDVFSASLPHFFSPLSVVASKCSEFRAMAALRTFDMTACALVTQPLSHMHSWHCWRSLDHKQTQRRI
jgi:hypothetical protein